MKKFVESQIDQMNIDNLHEVIIELVSSNKKLTDMADKMRQKCLDYSYREASLKRQLVSNQRLQEENFQLKHQIEELKTKHSQAMNSIYKLMESKNMFSNRF